MSNSQILPVVYKVLPLGRRGMLRKHLRGKARASPGLKRKDNDHERGFRREPEMEML